MFRREDQLYCPYFCEENIWHLAGRTEQAAGQVLVISNPARQVAIWGQALAQAPQSPVIWDYHVVLMVPRDQGGTARIYDFDTLLGWPVALDDYLEGSFLELPAGAAHLSPLFRVLSAARYRARLWTDRSHMRTEGGGWRAPPPPWPPPQGEDQGHNLDRFIDMAAPFEGDRLDLAGLRRLYL